jgi:hypothetical protein
VASSLQHILLLESSRGIAVIRRARVAAHDAREGGRIGNVRMERGEFKVTRNPVTPSGFDHWLYREREACATRALRNTKQRWFFGSTRARQRLYADARNAFNPRGTFCEAMKKRADELPVVVKWCALSIRKGAFGHMSTFDSEHCLCVVPRSIIQNDFRARMLRELSSLPQVQRSTDSPRTSSRRRRWTRSKALPASDPARAAD